jgi:ABC-type transport system involved in multi-copper enzyme maturation permease subunit
MRAPTLARLVRVEIRKTYDTRAGWWLLITLCLLGAAVALMLIFAGTASELNFEVFLLTAQLPIGVLLPVLGILAVTGEWSQRTALTTFALVPRRSRIMVAKALALIAVALLAVLASIIVAALGNVVAAALRDTDGSWGQVSTLVDVALFQVISVLVGVGLGMLLLSAPQAIVAYLLGPVILSSVASLVAALETPAQWLSLLDITTRLLGEEISGQGWAQIATAFAVWSLLPLLLGAVRIHRREIQ